MAKGWFLSLIPTSFFKEIDGEVIEMVKDNGRDWRGAVAALAMAAAIAMPCWIVLGNPIVFGGEAPVGAQLVKVGWEMPVCRDDAAVIGH